MNTQQISAIVRQVAAIAAVVMGALTASLQSIKLPPVVSAVLAAGGAILLAVEHYVGDPSTGSSSPAPVPPSAPAQPVPPAQPANPVQIA